MAPKASVEVVQPEVKAQKKMSFSSFTEAQNNEISNNNQQDNDF